MLLEEKVQAEYIKLLKRGESDQAEFKQSFDKETMETVGAFANSKGGIIFIGVQDNGKVIGISTGKDTLLDWVNQISQATDPRIIPEPEIRQIAGKEVGIIRIKEYPIKPVSVKGRCYKRVGKSNRVMTPQEIAQMHLQTIGISFDAVPLPHSAITDLSPTEIKKYLHKVNENGRRNIPEDTSPKKVLEKLELVKKGKPTLASILLFGKTPQEKLSQATIHCGRFKQESQIMDDKLIAGTVIEQVEEAMAFIRKHLSVKFIMTGKPEREEVWEYPLEALREAVINAVCHRDYSDNSDLQLKIFDDRLSIWNPGGLPQGLTIEDLFNPNHSSKPRNKLLAQIFYDVGLIERYGSGIQRILDACQKAGLPMPVFEEMSGGFLVIFNKGIYSAEKLEKLGLRPRQIKAVLYLQEKGRITNKDYQEICQLKKRQATIDLVALQKKGLLEKVGVTGKGTYYLLKIQRGTKATKGAAKGH